MLRLTQTEDFKTIISSCSTKEQVQKASENFMKRIIALSDAEDDTETSAKLIVQNLLISSYFCTFIV